jgi:uncharacterized protein (DUF736 family)
VIAGAATLVLGQFIFATVRSPLPRAPMTTAFALPAAVAGYHLALGLSAIGMTSDPWRHVFAVIGAIVVGSTAWARFTAHPLPASRSPSRLRWSRVRNEDQRSITMANIGSFKKVNAEFQGKIVTLSVQAKNVRIVPETNRTNDNAPSHRVFVGRAEIGAAFQRGPRLPLDQARRPELHRPHLRQLVWGRGRRDLQSDLVARSPAERRVSAPSCSAPAGSLRVGPSRL